MSVDCDPSTNESGMAQSSAAALGSSVSGSAAHTIVSPPRTKTKSKSCGNSPKCGSREHSRPQSPAMNWKKPSKSSSPVAEMEREGGEEAPFGRESGGGSAYSSPYSERATPPYLRWAKSLEDVLDDYEGMELFKQFLAEQKEGHLLDFWYACKGFKQLDTKECDRIRKVAERLYADYVAWRGMFFLPCLSHTTRTTIHSRLLASNTDIDQTMYDDAHKEVQTYLRDRHAQFVSSEAYILYLQDIQVGGWDSPKCYSHEVHSNNSSSSGENRRPSSTLLPTVHEVTEFESDSERLAAAASLNSTATASTAKLLATTETESACGGLWPNQASGSAKSCVQQNIVNAAMPAASSGASSGDDPSSAASSTGGAKRRATSIVSSGSGQQMRPAGSLLTRDTLVATFGQRLLATKPVSKYGGPPHPYHTPYVPYLPTSAQDSELQSMSSGATTESGFSGANYQRKEYRIMQQHVEHNRDPASNQHYIPRTDRSRGAPQAQDMMSEDFCRQVKEKLEAVRREKEREEKLQESLKRLSEPENGHNDHRAAVNKFYNDEKNRRCQNEDAEAILEDYCSRVPYFKDSPKQSPLRSPGLPSVGRRRSPIAKSPIRAMTTSYPSAGQPQLASFSHPNAKLVVDPTVVLSQSVVQPNRSKSGHHSAGNTIHRAPKHEQFVQAPVGPAPLVDKRAPGATAKKPFPRYAAAASDTSGIYSGTSTEPSLVSARLTLHLAQKGNEQYWNADRHAFENADSDGVRHKMRSSSSNNAASVPSAPSESKSHRTSSHRSGEKLTSTEKSRNPKSISDGSAGQIHKSLPSYPRRSEPVGLAAQSFCACAPVQEITVGIFLPNEKTPYLVRFPGHQITLKQFKPLIPRKGNFRYFFQCVSDELGTGTVQREVVEDHEVLPFCDNNKIVAKIVVNE